MSCLLYGKIAPTRTLWMFTIAALSAGLLVQMAMADNFPQSSALQPQPTNWWQIPAPRPYVPPSRQVHGTSAQQPQPTNLRRLPPTQSGPLSWSVSDAYAQVPTQPTHSSYTLVPQTRALQTWPVDYSFAQGLALPASALYPQTQQQYTLPSWPAIYNFARQPAQPTNTWQFPAPGTSSTLPTSPVSYNNLLQLPSEEESSSGGGSLSGEGPFISTRTFCYWNDDLMIDGKAEFPVLGRMNVAEHNSPLPRDRAYFIYKHYNNVLDNSISDLAANPLGQSTRGVDQYLVGYERTFHDERSSLELRMPFFSTGSSQFNAGFSSNDPSIGNFGVIAKRILHRDDLNAVSAGFAVTMPTGDDTVFSIGGQTFNFQNDVAHLIPFLGILRQTPDERWFVLSFAGLDIPARGNQIEFVDPVAGAQDLGRVEDQTLLYLDFTLGRWLYRNPCSDALTGFAVQGELHYAGTLNDANSLQGTLSGVGWNTGYNFGNTRNRFDSTFAALVLHAELQNQTDIRVTGIFPLNDSDNRFFDSELIVGIVQRF